MSSRRRDLESAGCDRHVKSARGSEVFADCSWHVVRRSDDAVMGLALLSFEILVASHCGELRDMLSGYGAANMPPTAARGLRL